MFVPNFSHFFSFFVWLRGRNKQCHRQINMWANKGLSTASARQVDLKSKYNHITEHAKVLSNPRGAGGVRFLIFVHVTICMTICISVCLFIWWCLTPCPNKKWYGRDLNFGRYIHSHYPKIAFKSIGKAQAVAIPIFARLSSKYTWSRWSCCLKFIRI